MTMPGPVAATERERKLWLWTGAALLVAALIGAVLVYRNVRATQGTEVVSNAGQGDNGSRSGGAREQAPVPPPTPPELPTRQQPKHEGADAGRPLSNKVRIVFRTFPWTRAVVTWGKQRLGFINPKAPLVIERPRDSGPMDVLIRAPGFLPVHTRAYTFDDSVVEVKLTTPAKKNTLYGYREPLPASDAGAPSAPAQ